jgi:hypothetical protein
MANDVFANGSEVACKAADGKSICAFPDVCMTPPENPATPPGVPVPYPNTGFARDTTDGSRTVRISDKEVMLKNKSYFKKSTGDEAGCAAKKGVITSTNRGKVYFIAWSSDVKFEGENADRHLDMTTHNHASPVANEAAPMAYVDSSAFGSLASCAEDKKKMEDACKDKDPCPGALKYPVGEAKEEVSGKIADEARTAAFAAHEAEIAAAPYPSRTGKAAVAATEEAEASVCVKAARCQLHPFEPKKCCPGQTPHHIPPTSCFGGQDGYDRGKALCICMEGASQHVGSHGKNHAAIEWLAKQRGIKVGSDCRVEEYNSLCAATIEAQCKCKKECIEDQLNEQFKDIKTVKHATTNSGAEVPPKLQQSILKSANPEVPVNI